MIHRDLDPCRLCCVPQIAVDDLHLKAVPTDGQILEINAVCPCSYPGGVETQQTIAVAHGLGARLETDPLKLDAEEGLVRRRSHFGRDTEVSIGDHVDQLNRRPRGSRMVAREAAGRTDPHAAGTVGLQGPDLVAG